MKKICALILAASMLLLCACSTDGTSEKKSPATTAAITAESEKEIISEWGSDLLPENFPAPPEGTYNFEIAQGNHETDESDYASDWVRIRFTCPTHNLHTFTNAFLSDSYTGGSRTIASDLNYYRNGVHGYWYGEEKIVKINSSTSNISETTLIVDIVPVTKGLPDELLQFFPEFDGVSVGNGVYCGHDASLEFISSNPTGGLSRYWHWEFLSTGSTGNCFVGVTQDDFENYCDLLGEAKFSGPITSATVDGFNVTMVDVVKDIDGTTYGVYMLYNPSLMTLDIAFTNNPKLITMDY